MIPSWTYRYPNGDGAVFRSRTSGMWWAMYPASRGAIGGYESESEAVTAAEEATGLEVRQAGIRRREG